MLLLEFMYFARRKLVADGDENRHEKRPVGPQLNRSRTSIVRRPNIVCNAHNAHNASLSLYRA